MDLVLLFQIFWVFLRITFHSFGGVFGVLPELERWIVQEHGWITQEAFVQAYALSQFIPGPNMAMCPLIGYWIAGWPGWVAGFLGIYSGPLLIMGLAAKWLQKYMNSVWLKEAELGLRSLVIGLLAASSLRLLWIQSTPLPSSHAPAMGRVLALGLCGVGAVFYARKKLGSLSLVLLSGGMWWALNRIFF